MWAKHPEIAKRWTDKYGSKVKKKEYKRVVDTKMKSYGDIDYEKRKIRVNPKKGDLINTVCHEEAHKKYPNKTEKQIRSVANKVERSLGIKKTINLLKRYGK